MGASKKSPKKENSKIDKCGVFIVFHSKLST
jgi:hypothetical protein